jgi:hypothetical protein
LGIALAPWDQLSQPPIIVRAGALNRSRRMLQMNGTSLIGIALIVLGVIAFAYQGITYTTREKVIDIGPIQASVEKEKTVPLPPVLGALALAGGIVLLIAGTRQGR